MALPISAGGFRYEFINFSVNRFRKFSMGKSVAGSIVWGDSLSGKLFLTLVFLSLSSKIWYTTITWPTRLCHWNGTDFSGISTYSHLPSSSSHTAFSAQHYGRRAFSVAGPMAWNSLPDFIRDPTSSTNCSSVYLKRTCSRDTSASSALAILNDYALSNPSHRSLSFSSSGFTT